MHNEIVTLFLVIFIVESSDIFENLAENLGYKNKNNTNRCKTEVVKLNLNSESILIVRYVISFL